LNLRAPGDLSEEKKGGVIKIANEWGREGIGGDTIRGGGRGCGKKDGERKTVTKGHGEEDLEGGEPLKFRGNETY